MKPWQLKIDSFTHIMPLEFKDLMLKNYSSSPLLDIRNPAMYDMDVRFRIMDRYEGLMHVLTLASPPIEDLAGPDKSLDLCKVANDGMAELVFKHPDRFAAAVASLPMNNMDAALNEVDRTINDLKFRGVQIFTNVNGKPIDSPEFLPLYEKMVHYNLPIWLHPWRTPDFADYKTEEKSKYMLHFLFGWPYETTAAMTRLVFSRVLEKYPSLKIITHHCGALIPSLWQRITHGVDGEEMTRRGKMKQGLTKAPIEYYRMFYADTAINDNTPGLMNGYAFFGVDRLLFASDMPYENQMGDRKTRENIAAVEKMEISDLEKKKIFEDNARVLFRVAL
jgi:predicted TIM-barrel fold metal-dependent hydrolase